MKILQIGMGWFPDQPGGLNRVYYDCLNYLPQAGVEITGLVASSSQPLDTSANRVHSFAPRETSLPHRWWHLRRSFNQHLQKRNYDLVASHFALYTSPILDCIGPRPLIMHFHGPWALEGNVEGNRTLATWFKKQIELPTYRKANRFIVLSQAFRDILHQEYGIPLDRIHIVPGGVNLTQFQTNQSKIAAREALGWPTDRPILLAVRRLAKRMGLENLVTAINAVRQHHPDVLLLIAGKGSLKDTIQQQISELGLGNHVRLLGYLPDEQLPLAYRAAELSIVPTVALEGFGLIVIESLAAGTPVLGTPIGGIPEILRPLSPDLIFASPEANDIAAHISNALAGQLNLPSDSACQDYVKSNYAWPIVAQQIKAVYEKALLD